MLFRRFFFSSRRRHTRSKRDWSSDVCSSDLASQDLDGKEPEAIKAIVETLASATQRVQRENQTLESQLADTTAEVRSEERRVGKEGRSRWSRYHWKNKSQTQVMTRRIMT